MVFAELRNESPLNIKTLELMISDLLGTYGYGCLEDYLSYVNYSNNCTTADVILQNTMGYKQCKRKASDCDGGTKKKR